MPQDTVITDHASAVDYETGAMHYSESAAYPRLSREIDAENPTDNELVDKSSGQ
ncbi:hypothetical protein [Paenarthrobacter nicotinovorans]|uniref:hypothetical protein n=1 Tax=Paenarthrobacter nicotinovorans TaxID=29320 RepID=UPI00036EA232|nr:hypothetical protein [Paenarthrobacter nicotinovorans]